jgi:hypothetical protein
MAKLSWQRLADGNRDPLASGFLAAGGLPGQLAVRFQKQFDRVTEVLPCFFKRFAL